MLSQIERLEVQKARLEGRIVDAYAALHSVEEQQLARLTTSSPVPITADQVAAQEIACATGVGVAEVSRRLELATAPRRHRVLRQRLRAGAVSLQRALRIVVETRMLDDDVIADLEATVLAPARDGSIASQRLFGDAVAALRASGRPARCRGAAGCATARRTVFGRLVEDGMGTFTVVASAERVVGVLDRVDAMARAARATGDVRSLDQLRSDLLCDLALYGVVRVPVSGTGGELAGTGGATDRKAPPGRELSVVRLSDAPPAAVRIVVPSRSPPACPTPPCELAGHGWVTAPTPARS